MSASDAARSAAATGPSSSSIAPATRRIMSGRARRSPPQQGSLGGEAGPEADHEAPLARHGRRLAQRLLEHEEDRRRRHVAVAGGHGAGGRPPPPAPPLPPAGAPG